MQVGHIPMYDASESDALEIMNILENRPELAKTTYRIEMLETLYTKGLLVLEGLSVAPDSEDIDNAVICLLSNANPPVHLISSDNGDKLTVVRGSRFLKSCFKFLTNKRPTTEFFPIAELRHKSFESLSNSVRFRLKHSNIDVIGSSEQVNSPAISHRNLAHILSTFG